MSWQRSSNKKILELSTMLLHAKISEPIFCGLFGMSSLIFQKLWIFLTKYSYLFPKKWKILHLFMTLNFLKNPQNNLGSFSTFWRKNPKTIMKYVEITLKLLNSTLPKVITWHLIIITD
jgi:hypothetical protein